MLIFNFNENNAPMNKQSMRELFLKTRTIAVVGISSDPDKASHYVPRYLQQQGFRILPVNPRYPEVLGERCYASLRDIPIEVDMVNVFRRAGDCPSVAEQAVAIGAKSLWLQLGIASQAAQEIASEAKLSVVMDACIMIEHERLIDK